MGNPENEICPAPRSRLSLIKWFFLLVALGVVVKELSALKSQRDAFESPAFTGRVNRYGTSDPILQQAFQDNDVATIKARIHKLPPSEITPRIVEVLATDATAVSLDTVLDAGWNPAGHLNDNAPLFQAIRFESPRAVEVLLRHGVSPNAVDSGGEPALIVGLRALLGGGAGTATDKLSRVESVLLDHGADVDKGRVSSYRDSNGLRTFSTEWPLESAIETGHVWVAKLLLDHKANPNWMPKGGAPPLILAAGKAEAHIEVKALLDHGAKPSELGTMRLHLPVGKPEMVTATALYFHALSGDAKSVELLLSHGADPNIIASNGKTVYEAARGDALEFLRKYLKQKGELLGHRLPG